MPGTLDLWNALGAQRWFAGKGKKIAEVRCMAKLPLVEMADWQIVEVRYEDGTRELYQMPLIGNADALADAGFREQIFKWLGENRTISTDAGNVRIEIFSIAPPASDSLLLTIEQSHSSISYGGTSFLKVFRKLESGLNPDIEILSYLNERHGFVRVPKIYATLTLENAGESYALAVFQEMVANRGNAWEVALEAARTGEDFREQAALLGRRTAELHLALAAETNDPAFGIIQSSVNDWELTSKNLHREFSELRHLLEVRLPSLTCESADLTRSFIATAPAQLEKLTKIVVTFPLIRIHGDYHLGQVLVTDDDFVIIDFEGEPARPLSERRQHRSSLIDVAGMLRSFHYVGCMAGAFDWQKKAAYAFLSAYFSKTRGSRILPDDSTTQTLLEVFSWQKKLYEIRYELNNRPDWLWIPLQ